MPTLRTVLHDPDEVARHRQPRDDALVHERAVEVEDADCDADAKAGVFVADAGPFAVWERHITTQADGTTEETLRYAIGAPHWGRLVDLALRRTARRGVAPGRTPWWCPSNRLSQRDATVLGLCATLSLIAGFLGALIPQTIAAITDDLGGDTGTQARALVIIRVGSFLTFAVLALADRRGRRPMMATCLLGSAAACLLTAAAPNVDVVIATQLVARGLAAGAAFLIPIICAEELPARSRAYAIGLMSLPGGLGAGMVLWCLPALDHLGRSGWRAIYLLALIAMLATWRTVRRLPETRRYEHDDHVLNERAHQHMKRSRLLLLGAAAFLLSMFVTPTQQLQNDYLLHTRQMNFTAIFIFLVLTNTWGFIGIVGGGQLADRFSRRLAASIGVLGLAVGNTLMFQFGGAPMWAASLMGSVIGGAVIPSMGALVPELFPTLRRGSANGLMNLAGVGGSVAGLLIVGHFVSHGRYGPTVAALSLGPLAVAGLVWLLPETAGVELEALNPDT